MAQDDPWNLFYFAIYDPARLGSAPKTDLDVISTFKTYRWGIYQQKPGATGTGKNGPVTISAQMSEISQKSALLAFSKVLEQRGQAHDFTGYESPVLSGINRDSKHVLLSVSFAPKGGFPEWGHQLIYRRKSNTFKDSKFLQNKLNCQADEYNNNLRRNLGNNYRAPEC